MVSFTARPTTVGASFARQGPGRVTARSGASADLAERVADAGFTPVELMDAALAGCLVQSVRIAARKLGWLDRLERVAVDVTHEKAPDQPSRVAVFAAAFVIEGEFSDEERQSLIADAHCLCTVGNTLLRGAVIVDVEPEAPAAA